MTTDAEKIEAVLLKLETDSGKLHDVVHGSDTATISVTSGNVSSMAKAIKDISSAGTTEINKVKNDGAQAITTFSTDSGSAITKFNTDGAAAIATIVDSLKYALKDFSNISINDALAKLGLEGLNRNKSLDSYTDNTTLSSIGSNSIYSYPTTATDSPKASSAGIVQTWIIDANNATQVSITTSVISSDENAVQYRVKTGGTYGNWQALGGAAGGGSVTPPYTPRTVTTLPIIGDSQGAESCAIILKDGTVKMWGRGSYHQLGQGDDLTDKNSPVEPLFPSGAKPIKKIFHAARCWIAQDTQNDIYVWGRNSSGCLGVGHSAPVKIPTKLDTSTSPLQNFIIKSVSIWFGNTTYQHCAMVSEAGSLVVCGYNRFGQLGVADNRDRTRFLKAYISGVVKKAIAVGGYEGKTYYVSDQVYATGRSTNDAPLGDGGTSDRASFVAINRSYYNGTLYDRRYVDISVAYDETNFTAVVATSPLPNNDAWIYQWGNDDMFLTQSESQKTDLYPETYGYMRRSTTSWIPSFTFGDNIIFYSKDNSLFYKYSDNRIPYINSIQKPITEGRAVIANYSFDFSPLTVTKKIFSTNGQIALLLSDYSIYAKGYNDEGNLGLGDNAKDEGFVSGTRNITKSEEQIVDISFVGSQNETSLSYLTREGKYYQTGPLGRNYIFLTDKATKVPIEIKFQ